MFCTHPVVSSARFPLQASLQFLSITSFFEELLHQPFYVQVWAHPLLQGAPDNSDSVHRSPAEGAQADGAVLSDGSDTCHPSECPMQNLPADRISPSHKNSSFQHSPDRCKNVLVTTLNSVSEIKIRSLIMIQ